MQRDGTLVRWGGTSVCRRSLSVAGTTIHWVEAGSGSPLLLLHGYGGSARWWERNLEGLAAQHHLFALDLPGFGDSRLRGPFSFERAVLLLDAWMAALQLPAAAVLGHSMGGQVALLLAAAHPERVRALVLLAPAGLPFDTGLPGLAWRAVRSRSGGDRRFTPIVVAGSLRAGPRIMWQAIEQIRATDVRRYLAAVRAPTLILWGEADRLLTAASGPPLAAALPGAELRILQGVGHNLMFDRPAEVNGAVLSFLRGLGGAADERP